MGQLLAFADRYEAERGIRSRLCLVASYNQASLRGFSKSGASTIGRLRVITVFGTPMYIVPKSLRDRNTRSPGSVVLETSPDPSDNSMNVAPTPNPPSVERLRRPVRHL